MIKNYFKIAWRNILKRKAFTLIHLTGLGIAFTSAIIIFLFISHHLKFDNFHEESDQIYRIVTEEHREGEIDYEAAVPPGLGNEFRTVYDYAKQSSKVVFYDYLVLGVGDESDQKLFKENITYVEEDFMHMFNFPLLNGGVVDLGALNTAAITERTAMKWFGTTEVIGKTIQVDNHGYVSIVGVLEDLPKTTLFASDVFISYASIDDDFLAGDGWNGINGSLKYFIKLESNVDIPLIESQMLGFVDKYRPNSSNVHKYKLQPFDDIHFDPNYGGAMDVNLLWIFSVIGILLLLVASINFINISTAQSSYRAKEIGVRKVLGGQKGQLFWQFISETMMLCGGAFILALGVTYLLLPIFNTTLDLPLDFNNIMNLSFLGSGLTMIVTVSFFAGIYPGLVLSSMSPMAALRSKLSSGKTKGFSARKSLVVSQFGIAMLLIIGTLIIDKQITFGVESDLGFDRSSVYMINVPEELDGAKYDNVKSRLSTITGIENISGCWGAPGAADNSWGTNMVYNQDSEDGSVRVVAKLADEEYLNTFDLDLVAGRNIFHSDTAQEFLINESFIRKLGITDPEEVIGKPVSIGGDYLQGQIVGVLADFHNNNFKSDIDPIFVTSQVDFYSKFAVKLNVTNSASILSNIEREWTDMFPGYLFEYLILDEEVAEQYASEQKILSLVKIFSGLTVFLACLGVYGLISFIVVQKTKEIGVRKVLGATVSSIVGLLSKEFVILVIIAFAIATPIAWYLMEQWQAEFAYKAEISPLVYVGAGLFLVGVTFAAISFQSIKAALVNPVKSLRTE